MSEAKFEVDKEKLEVRLSRVFNALPERLWKAHTEADQIIQWWENTVVDKLELKVGGAWRYISSADGKEFAFSGVFKELDEPNKIVRTFEFEPVPGHVMVETLTLESLPEGKTKQTAVSKFENLEDLSTMVGMGMEEGAEAGLDRIAALVE